MFMNGDLGDMANAGWKASYYRLIIEPYDATGYLGAGTLPIGPRPQFGLS